jgi:hypothetical protein
MIWEAKDNHDPCTYKQELTKYNRLQLTRQAQFEYQ